MKENINEIKLAHFNKIKNALAEHFQKQIDISEVNEEMLGDFLDNHSVPEFNNPKIIIEYEDSMQNTRELYVIAQCQNRGEDYLEYKKSIFTNDEWEKEMRTLYENISKKIITKDYSKIFDLCKRICYSYAKAFNIVCCNESQATVISSELKKIPGYNILEINCWTQLQDECPLFWLAGLMDFRNNEEMKSKAIEVIENNLTQPLLEELNLHSNKNNILVFSNFEGIGNENELNTKNLLKKNVITYLADITLKQTNQNELGIHKVVRKDVPRNFFFERIIVNIKGLNITILTKDNEQNIRNILENYSNIFPHLIEI